MLVSRQRKTHKTCLYKNAMVKFNLKSITVLQMNENSLFLQLIKDILKTLYDIVFVHL